VEKSTPVAAVSGHGTGSTTVLECGQAPRKNGSERAHQPIRLPGKPSQQGRTPTPSTPHRTKSRSVWIAPRERPAQPRNRTCSPHKQTPPGIWCAKRPEGSTDAPGRSKSGPVPQKHRTQPTRSVWQRHRSAANRQEPGKLRTNKKTGKQEGEQNERTAEVSNKQLLLYITPQARPQGPRLGILSHFHHITPTNNKHEVKKT
jgi:hypothetical protein